MKITPFPALLLAILVWCHCVCSIAHARSHRLKTTTATTTTITSDNGTESTAFVDCDLVRPFFDTKNITLSPAAAGSPKSTTCGGKCCGEEMEVRLKQQARADFHSLIHHHSRSLQGLLATTADALRETVIVLLRRSENKTMVMFDHVYRSMAVQSRSSIRALYQAMMDYVSPANTPDNLQQPLTRETLQERIDEFFTRLFPIAYHYAINPHQDRQDFTDKFKSCLYERIDDIQPFGDTPQNIFKKIGKSLEATRILVQALTLGKTVLERTDNVLFGIGNGGSSSPQQEACYDALLRMTYCPKCKGIGKDVRPCRGFCTNVVRGCLTEPASELDLAWSGYVGTVEGLVSAVSGKSDTLGLNVRIAVRELDSRISDAIMHAMEDGPRLEEKVRKVCGRSELLPPDERSLAASTTSDAAAKSSPSSPSSSSSIIEVHAAAVAAAASSLPSSAHAQDDLLNELHKQLVNFLASVVRSRIFYGTLADAICEDYPDKHCWNGERIGEYTKTVVDSSLNAQRYNPEFTITMSSTPATYSGNTNTSALIDQLRHINQVVQSQLASDFGPDVFQGDEALEGSGSGDSPVWRSPGKGEIDDDEDDQDDDDEASGSGMGPTTTDPSMKTPGPPHTGSASTILLSSMALAAIICASLIA
ncbi:division abnormally delayed protein [Monomorium pharaonis]|uniref:division abnormally delayed protein n=1 Tax=Monomorium pharaonis TaxID=307658 RepID=UPI001745C764|nr:division abnormally delayed protein [Monomorium pharaonis]